MNPVAPFIRLHPSDDMVIARAQLVGGMPVENIVSCGEIVDGTVSIQAMGQRIFETILATASGAQSKSEKHGYGQNEFVPWQVGAVI